ncbi:MAG TPA: diaminopropionate ammonia-lyase [Xanthobacteraceae bacterium]|nr:diaminopropionate ammonia-lyase [Xanthobacteraceae bacterium]
MARTLYAEDGRSEVLSLAALADARREITSWPGYEPTPLRRLRGLAEAARVCEILYKDEAGRFGLGSFKALGGAYAVLRLLQREIGALTKQAPSARELMAGQHREFTARLTVTCATDGNHGRSVAWGAQMFGCRCVIYVHETVSEGRCRAIAAFGAEVRRVPGTYDDAVRRAAADAAAHGWHVVSDTSYAGYTEIPRDVMQGYALMAEEALAQTPAGRLPTHVFVQGGVGGLAAAICSYLWERLGDARPRFVVVEPTKADCLYRSAVAGKPTPAEGALDTIMAGLACGEVSIEAWRILNAGADAFMAIDDEAAAACMRLLATGYGVDAPVVAGESAVAGLAALLLGSVDATARRRLGLDTESSVLVFGTEGATDPEVYVRIVGRTPAEVYAASEHAR